MKMLKFINFILGIIAVLLSFTLIFNKNISYDPINSLAIDNLLVVFVLSVIAISNVYNFNRYREDFVFKAQLFGNAIWAVFVSFDLPSWLVWVIFLMNVSIIVINRTFSGKSEHA